jgi:hypothetical protein
MTCIAGVTAEVGDEYTAVFRLHDDDLPLQVTCVIRDVAPQRTGVEFVNITRTDRLRIAARISRGAGRNLSGPANSTPEQNGCT